MALLLTSLVAINTFGVRAANAQTSSDTGACEKLPIEGIVASGEENGVIGNVASNAVDMNPVTRWSNQGEGSFIRADLGQPTILCSVDISWYLGNSRKYNFVISISDDEVHFKDIVSGKSTGKKDLAERYKVPPVTAKYVR